MRVGVPFDPQDRRERVAERTAETLGPEQLRYDSHHTQGFFTLS
jgi:hypothetical protein